MSWWHLPERSAWCDIDEGVILEALYGNAIHVTPQTCVLYIIHISKKRIAINSRSLVSNDDVPGCINCVTLCFDIVIKSPQGPGSPSVKYHDS
jgi:hypothetical protein